jgi:hypothetical protein
MNRINSQRDAFRQEHPIKGEYSVIKIEFNGSGDEVRNEMLRLLGLGEPKAQSEIPVQRRKRKVIEVHPAPVEVRRGRVGRKPATTQSVNWTKKDAETLLNQIKPNAKRIIAELSNKPEGYRRSELTRMLGLQEQAIRGQLSSVGFALRRMGNKPSPISNEKVDGEFTYKLDSIVAGMAKQGSI